MICGVCGAARNTRIIRLQNLREATAAARHNGTAVLSQFFALLRIKQVLLHLKLELKNRIRR